MYATALNGDKAKAVARCKELIALHGSESTEKFLDKKVSVTFVVLAVELK